MSKLASTCTYHSKHFISLSVSYVSLQFLSDPSFLRSFGLGTHSQDHVFCVKREEEEVEDDWFGAPLATALHSPPLVYSIPPPPPPSSLFITACRSLASRANTHLRITRGSDRKTVGLKHLRDEYITEFNMTCVCSYVHVEKGHGHCHEWKLETKH